VINGHNKGVTKIKNYLLKHPEENLSIVMVTDEAMEEGKYFHALEGDVEERDICTNGTLSVAVF